MNALTNMSFPSLTTIGWYFSPNNLPVLTNMSFPSLTTVGGYFGLPSSWNCPVLTNISCPVLGSISRGDSGGTITFHTLPLLTTVNLSSLTNFGNIFTLGTTTNIQNFTLSTNLNWVFGSIIITNQRLTAASVSNILQAVNNLDGTNGKTNFNTGHVLNLSGGTSAAVTPGANLPYQWKTNIAARGATVTTN